MIYDIRHRTTYAYGSEVRFAQCVLRLIPPTTAGQTVLRSLVTVTPTPARSIDRIGPFGERTLTVRIETPHRELRVDSRARVDVLPRGPFLPFSPPWERAREEALSAQALDAESPASFLYPTRRTPTVDEITEYARESFPAGRPVFDATADLMERIHRDFVYDGDATSVSTPAAEAFAKRRGVCQDFAHIMICGLKGLGLPAAYVSGYLRTRPPPGQPRLEGADATHAWVSLWCGEAVGWVGFDPTNAMLSGESHIVLATGRDYSDVAPIDGLLLAPGDQALKVAVDVVPEGE